MGTLTLEDTLMDVIKKMSEGNPGAIHALMDWQQNGATIDPDSADSFFLGVSSLDSMGIRGTDIYVLYNDSCQRDIRKMIILVRANQLGFLTNERLWRAAKDQTRQHVFTEEEMSGFEEQVCENLTNFKKSKVEA